MDTTAIFEAVEILKTRRAKAQAKLDQMLTGAGDGAVFDSRKVAQDLVVMCDKAGVDEAYLLKYLKPQPRSLKRVHLALSMNMGPRGGERPFIYVDDLTRGSGSATIDLSAFQIEPGGDQTKADVEELLNIISDFNARTPGKCDEGLRLLKKVGIGGGILSAVFGNDTAKSISSRFSLWRIRQAVCEALLLKAREPKLITPLDELFLCRIGAAGLIPAKLTGDLVPGLGVTG